MRLHNLIQVNGVAREYKCRLSISCPTAYTVFLIRSRVNWTHFYFLFSFFLFPFSFFWETLKVLVFVVLKWGLTRETFLFSQFYFDTLLYRLSSTASVTILFIWYQGGKIIFTGSCLSALLRSHLEAVGQKEEEEIRNRIGLHNNKRDKKRAIQS